MSEASKPGMRRRTFLRASAVVGSLAALAGMWQVVKHFASEATPKPDEPALARAIRKRLPSLHIPEATLAAFVNDHEKKHGRFKGKKVSHDTVQDFVLSTDFFPAADESRPLSYVIYYDPYSAPCRNPFRT
jgi:hypothetical protein